MPKLWTLLAWKQFERHAHAGERGTQFVRHIGKHAFLCPNQTLYTLCGPIEAAREFRHLVIALDLDARRQFARA